MEKPSLVARFFFVLLKIIVVLILMVIFAVISFEGVTYYLTGDLYDLRGIVKEAEEISGNDDDELITAEVDDENVTNSLFFIESADGLKQYMMLNMLNTKTYALDILLIPSNAQMSVGSSLLSEIQKVMPDSGSTVLLSDVARSFGDEKYNMLSSIIENVMGIKISGYDVMSEADYIKFLNMAGTVTYSFDDPLSYRDEKGVLQEIEEGQQELDGSMAMALISYMDGSSTEESARLERTSTYLESFIDALLSHNKSSAILKKYTNLCQSSDGRDISEADTIISKLEDEAITIRILQGSESDGVFTVDSQKARLQVSTLMSQAAEYGSSGSQKADSDDEDDTDSTGSTESSKGYSIELYNAAYVSGLAAQWESFLEEEGYSISLVDSYQDEGPLSTTRIIVAEEGLGEDLLKYFPDATIEVDDIDTGGDIQVYIGTDCTNVGSSSEEDTDYDDEDGYDTDDSHSSGDLDEDSQGNGSYNFDTDSE